MTPKHGCLLLLSYTRLGHDGELGVVQVKGLGDSSSDGATTGGRNGRYPETRLRGSRVVPPTREGPL